MIVERYKAKSLVRTSNRSPHHIHLNIYQGCYHNCAYCDGKSEEYFMHDDYGTRIRAKINAPELLESYLSKKGFLPVNRDKTDTMLDFISNSSIIMKSNNCNKFVISIFGNICDVYQPLEKELKITRQILQIAYDYGFPVRILTKNILVLRDLEILKKINQISFARVAFTVTLADETDRRNFEPHASSTQERIKAIRKFNDEGISSGAYITPVLPWIGDTQKNWVCLFEGLKSVKADFVVSGGLTLKPGKNKKDFLKVINKYYPQFASRYEKLYKNNSPYGQPDTSMWIRYNLSNPVKVGYKLSSKYGINYYESRYIPEGTIRDNIIVATILSRIAFLKGEIIEESWEQATDLRETALKIEVLSKNILEMNNREILELSDKEHVLSHLFEITKYGESSYLYENGDNSKLFQN